MDKFICEYCNNEYKSANSRLNHYKAKHLDEYTEKKQLKLEKRLNCGKCDKKLSDRNSKYRHELICNRKKTIEELQNNLKILTEQMNLLLNTKNKIHPKKLQKINKQLINNNTTNNITNNITNIDNNGTINYNTNNIINIINFGEEDLSKILQINEMLKIFTEYKQRSLEESIKSVHFNDDRPEYQNIYITCMDSDVVYIYEKDQFVEASKKEVINKLINEHCNYIVKTVEECKSEMSKDDYNKIKAFINKIYFGNTEFKHHDFKDPFPTYKDYKVESVKLIIYKNSNKILNNDK
jgi:hypothetical protein